MCRQEKALDQFGPEPRVKSGLQARCYACKGAMKTAWSKANPQRVAQGKAEWAKKNPERMKKAEQDYRARNKALGVGGDGSWYRVNKDAALANTQKWREANRDRHREINARRRAARRSACVPWADRRRIAEVYAEANRLTAETGIPHEVDHIVPLVSPVVCGLHVEHNLQVLTRAANQKKGNRYGH